MLKKLLILSLLASSQFVSAEVSQRKLLKFLKVITVNNLAAGSHRAFCDLLCGDDKSFQASKWFSAANLVDALVKTKLAANESDSRTKSYGKLAAKVVTSLSFARQNVPSMISGKNTTFTFIVLQTVIIANAIFAANKLVDYVLAEPKELDTQEKQI